MSQTSKKKQAIISLHNLMAGLNYVILIMAECSFTPPRPRLSQQLSQT